MIFVFLAFLGAVYVLYRLVAQRAAGRGDGRRSYEANERARMPAVIAGGRLVISEEYFRTTVPRPLGARLDQAYIGSDGLVYPVDSKTRDREVMYETDRIELSVQAAVLRTGNVAVVRGHTVASIGYVRVVTARGITYLPTKLLNDAELTAVYDRREALLLGDVVPTCIQFAGACRKCAYRSNCETGSRRAA